MSKSRLGRGLSAILEDVEEAYKSDVESDKSLVKKIDIDNIVPNIYQPRKHFDSDALNSLSESIKKHGLLQPIVVIKKDEGFMSWRCARNEINSQSEVEAHASRRRLPGHLFN